MGLRVFLTDRRCNLNICAVTDVVDGEHVKARRNHARRADHRVIEHLPPADRSQLSQSFVHLHLPSSSPTQQQQLV